MSKVVCGNCGKMISSVSQGKNTTKYELCAKCKLKLEVKANEKIE